MINKSLYLSFAALPLIAFGGAAAGFVVEGHQQSPIVHADAEASQQPATTVRLKEQTVTMTVLPGGRLGPDGKMHDVVTNANITVVEGVPAKLTVYNYDGGAHSVTVTALGLNLQAKGSTKNGVPAVTSVVFTPKKTGTFSWQCIDPCDGQNNGWAMTHNGYMEGTMRVVPQSTNVQHVYLTIKDGLHYASVDGKLHDSYSPASFTVQKGIPVQVQVENYDTGSHSLTDAGLKLQEMFPGAKNAGVPSVTTFTFTPHAAGSFPWQCMIPCDGPNGWAMSHAGYMAGVIQVN